MPDVKSPPPCDYLLARSTPSGSSPSRCASSFFSPDMDADPCVPDLPPPPPGALPAFPQHGGGHGVAQYPLALQGAPYSFMSRCNSSSTALLTNLGLRHCSARQAAYVAVPPTQGRDPCACLHADSCSGGGGRPYRSMENLNWNSAVDPGMYGLAGGPYRSLESEFVFRCTETSHWYDGPPDGAGMGLYSLMPGPESLAFYPRRGPPRKDLALFPHWLFPGGADECDARKGLREKLRLQSARSTGDHPKHSPLRPQAAPGTLSVAQGPREHQGTPYHHPSVGAGAAPKPLCAVRLTSPEEIKQEVLRRLQLRRQNSSPNLALHSSSGSPAALKSSYTTDNVTGAGDGPDPASERRRVPAGRLHIPTFEEFKRMRRKSADGRGAGDAHGPAANSDEAWPRPRGETDARTACGSGHAGRMEGDGTEGAGCGGAAERTCDGDAMMVPSHEGPHAAGRSGKPGRCSSAAAHAAAHAHTSSPIRTGPVPRSPLQPLAGSAPARGPGVVALRAARRSSLEGGSGGGRATGGAAAGGRPSSCCPALLLDGTELSNYGAKIYKMKDGLIGSALDLILKSCSAEISAEGLGSRSGDRDGGADITAPPTDCQSSPVSMATAAVAVAAPSAPAEAAAAAALSTASAACSADGWEETADGDEETAECFPGVPGCRRSSSDAAYEPAASVKAQRECRLRPHYSDPMPADAAKRKQLEMKIAVAARLHSQRRDRDRDGERDRHRDSAPAALRGHSEPRGEERAGTVGSGGGGGGGGGGPAQHRWSTVSSLSADSGVVGLGDERDDEDGREPRLQRQRQRQRHRRVGGGCGGGGGNEVERADSGIGPGLSRGWKRPSAALRAWEARQPCPDCGLRDGERSSGGAAMCERCSKLRTERKEAILEFLSTEMSYGEDLRIIREEFYVPMQSAGLLSTEQLSVVFANVQELIDVNERFTDQLQDSIDQAFDQGDEDLLTVCIGEIFLEFVNMLPAFQTYCLQQSTSVTLLNAVEKEKELLRIFLDVSQNDNTALRRMNLRSFLMAPLQRVTKYPLLLSRIGKASAECHPDHGPLREAKLRVESHLEHINMKTRQEGAGVAWSLRSFRRDSRKNREVINIEMREVSVKTVGWPRERTRFVMEGALQLSQPADGQWVKKGSKALKFQNVQSLLMVRMQRVGEGLTPGSGPDEESEGPRPGDPWQPGGECIRDGVLVLIKDKSSGKFAVLREPIRLGNCVVSADPDCEDTFEVLDIRRESFVFRASDKSRTQQWFRQIKRYARDLGPWRKRRNALPNIMINTNQSRS